MVTRAPSPPTPIRDTAAQDRPVGPPRGRRIRRLALLGAGLVGLALVGWLATRWLSAGRSVDAARVRIAEVTRGALVRDAAVTGRVVAAVSPTLYAPVPGTVALAIRAGDTVTKGQLVATLDSPELTAELLRERSTLAELDAGLGSAKIAAGQQRLAARREADEADIALTAAERERQSARAGFETGVVPELDVLRAEDAVKGAKIRHANAIEAAALGGKSAGFDVATAAKQRERQRLIVADLERRVAELEVRAPVDGVVGTLSVADRAAVARSQALMTVVDLARLEVELEVPEAYADDLGLGMTAEVTIGATRASGAIAALSPEVVSGHVLARVRFAGAQPPGLRQRQRVSARILIDERPDVVMLARGPFLEAHGGRAVYVVDADGVARRRAIELGATSVAAVEVVRGLQPGERVVIAGSERFEDADAVRLAE